MKLQPETPEAGTTNGCGYARIGGIRGARLELAESSC